VKVWRITYFYADGGSGLIIECTRIHKPSRLARARMDMDIDPVRYEIEVVA
jgi:hypothetical protein